MNKKNKKVLIRWFCGRYFGKRNASREEVDCSNCKKHGMMDCPNSSLCYSTENKPFFEQMDGKDGK